MWRRCAAGLGQEVHVIDPFGESGLPCSSFNPLATLDATSPDVVEDIGLFADALITHSEQGERHWTESAQGLKGAPIAYRMLLTKMSPLRTRVTDFAYQELARHGFPIFRSVMVERVAYREMFLTGQPPAGHEASGAGGEITALIAEMEAIVSEVSGRRVGRELAEAGT